MQAQHSVTAADSKLIARATRLRARVWALHYAQGSAYARNLAALWKAHGLAGVGLACRELARTLADVPGAHECFSEARAIAHLAPQ
jgi:hypothetical protein